MNTSRILAIAAIVFCTAAAWFMLGNALQHRSEETRTRLSGTVTGNLGGPMEQVHPTAYYISPTSTRAKRGLPLIRSRIGIDLDYEPRKKGLLWYRAFEASFEAEYLIKNTTPITQTVYLDFNFPAREARYEKFALTVGEKSTEKVPMNGAITESVILKSGQEIPLRVTYQSQGVGNWIYSFGNTGRIRDFSLRMQTNFPDFDIPAGTESPTARKETGPGWTFTWEHSDLIGAHAIGMEMPAVVNPGPVAARMTFFAPISLLFFFAVLVILGAVKGVNLHPMNYFFLAAGCFAFQLLFAYLVDLIPVRTAFTIAAVVSLVLVTGYLWRASGWRFARLAALAQFAYMVLFSYSFFFQGLTGITITIGAVVTLAILMAFTAKVDWNTLWGSRSRRGRSPASAIVPPPVPPPAPAK